MVTFIDGPKDSLQKRPVDPCTLSHPAGSAFVGVHPRPLLYLQSPLPELSNFRSLRPSREFTQNNQAPERSRSEPLFSIGDFELTLRVKLNSTGFATQATTRLQGAECNVSELISGFENMRSGTIEVPTPRFMLRNWSPSP